MARGAALAGSRTRSGAAVQVTSVRRRRMSSGGDAAAAQPPPVTNEGSDGTISTTKKTLIGYIKRVSGDLTHLEESIDSHELLLKKHHANHDSSAVLQSTDKLRTLYKEHKRKLDDMLLFWVLGGGTSLASLAIAWYRSSVSQSSLDIQHLSDQLDRKLEKQHERLHSDIQAVVHSAVEERSQSSQVAPAAGQQEQVAATAPNEETEKALAKLESRALFLGTATIASCLLSVGTIFSVWISSR